MDSRGVDVWDKGATMVSAGASRVREIWNAAKETRLDVVSQI